jgi:uncharacterized membrane protein
MLARFLIYGAAGWCIEVLFTGLWALFVQRNAAAQATTYLWMHPIYGAGGLLLELAADHLTPIAWPVRAVVYVALIYAVELFAGWALRRLIGRCPWDYTGQGWNVRGLIRLDYAPAWYVAALLFEPVRSAVSSLT